MMVFNRYFNSRGETLIELLIATFIIGITLTVVISAFMSGRSGVVSSWNRTDENFAASSVMEQIKATPYETIKDFQGAIGIDISTTSIPIDPSFSGYEIQLDILPYQDYPTDELLQVNVYVRTSSERPWVEKASLIRKGDSS